ncbi:MAG: MBL fold metallo-hydrolase [Myxococcales bacterium]|nr:MBL fold metallo-hydrolase [Myxococcales bacterium]
MIFRQLFDSVSSTYTYLLADPTSHEAVLVDPVFEHHERDSALLRELDLKLAYTLDTHVHADHVSGAWLMKHKLGSKIVLSGRYGADNVDMGIDHGDAVRFGDYVVTARATPGHTAGCLSYVSGDESIVFTGDALLIRGAGRTDFQGGDGATLYRSIKEQIFTLPDACLVYPAHDYDGRTVSSVGEEKRHNPRIGGSAREQDFVGFMNSLGLAHPKKIAVAVPANMRCGEPEAEIDEAVASWGPVTLSYAAIHQIDPEWVLDHRDAVHLLDVRKAHELQDVTGQIEGVQLLPLDELRERLDEVPRDKPVVAVCHAGSRSAQATRILRGAGVEAANLVGGMVRWNELSFPVVRADES